MYFQARSSLEDKNVALNETIQRLRDDLRNAENRKSAVEQELRQAQNQLNDLQRRLSVAEATLEVAHKVWKKHILLTLFIWLLPPYHQEHVIVEP